MSLENTAIDAKTKLKQAIKAGKSECATLATVINQIIDQGLCEYLTIPGDTISDKLHNLITLPYGQGGLNTEIHEVDALLSISPSTQRKFRTIVHQAKQGARTDLKPQVKEDKVDAEISADKPSKPSGKKAKKPSSSQLATDRSATRAAEALPEIDRLLESGLVAKDIAAKVGQVVKDPENPSPQEKKILDNRQKVKEELTKILPDPLPEDPKERDKIRKQVKEVIENTTGKKSNPRVVLSCKPEEAAKTIATAVKDINYLQQLIVAIEFEIEDMQSSFQSESSSQKSDNRVLAAA
jgi:hypothetical protein